MGASCCPGYSVRGREHKCPASVHRCTDTHDAGGVLVAWADTTMAQVRPLGVWGKDSREVPPASAGHLRRDGTGLAIRARVSSELAS